MCTSSLKIVIYIYEKWVDHFERGLVKELPDMLELEFNPFMNDIGTSHCSIKDMPKLVICKNNDIPSDFLFNHLGNLHS